jgi:hypothetical protein
MESRKKDKYKHCSEKLTIVQTNYKSLKGDTLQKPQGRHNTKSLKQLQNKSQDSGEV